MASASNDETTESNEVLKQKFRKLHMTVVDNVNPANAINFLFQEAVIGPGELRSLLNIKDDPQRQCSELLALLHTSQHPQAFIQLYLALKREPHLQWLVDRIDKYSVIDLLQKMYITEPRVGQVVHTLSEGRPVWGVTSLGEHIYLLRRKELHDGVEVYDVSTYRLVCCPTVPNARGFADMTSCEHFLCLYISGGNAECIHRLDLQGNAEHWLVNDEPTSLSVNADHNLIVTCREVRKIKVFSPRGDLLRDVTLPSDVIHPWHAIQLTSGQFIVCHGSSDSNDPVHRVCKITAGGGQIVQSHGGCRGSGPDQYSTPGNLAIDSNEFVFVADVHNRRVKLLSPTLNFIRHVVSSHQLKWKPQRLRLDIKTRRLYVIDNEVKDGMGRVVVFSV